MSKAQLTSPLIGLTTYGRNEIKVDSIHYDDYFAIPAHYVDSVRRAGGIPVLIPPGSVSVKDDEKSDASSEHWQTILDSVDGVIIIGGCDIHPSRYSGEVNHPKLTHHDLERDASEIVLTECLLNDTLPVLGICRGMQVMNVALGGSLIEHIPDVQEQDIHRNDEGGWQVQGLHADASSKLANTMQSTDVITYSGHHQAVKAVGDGLKVTAHAPDGIVEAIEHEEHPWFVAVQWHPEMSAAEDETQQRLFDELVEEARKRKLATVA